MHSFVNCLVHVVFATKGRLPLLTPEIQQRLWPYLAGIAKENKFPAIQIGGVADHVHGLISLPSTLSISKAMQLLKGNSSKWIHATFPRLARFEWQEGYGAFSIGISGIENTVAYILNQAEHHREKSFAEEFAAILLRHGIKFESKMLE